MSIPTWRNGQAGFTLIEVVVAMVVATTAFAAFAGAVLGADRAYERARSREAEIESASQFLNRVALWSTEEYDARLGDRSQGSWVLRILRPGPALYQITLSDGTSGALLLETAVYRPQGDADPR